MKVVLLAATALLALLPPTFAASEEQQLSGAGLQTYSELVYSHLQQYKLPYPGSANGPSGSVVVRLVLGRDGDVVSSMISKSSGNATLDEDALAIVQRAKPFPRFPANSAGSRVSFNAPFYFHPGDGPVCERGTMVKMPDGRMHPCQ